MGTTEDVVASSFEKLAAVNVSEKVEKKNGFSYLSWAWAWDKLMRLAPDASYEYPEPKTFGETMMVYCTVTAFGKARTAHLPVMDHRNKPIANPDAFQVNTAMQRCFVKAIALHGLGLYLYAGEDLPATDEEEKKKNGNFRPAVNVVGQKPYKMKEGCEAKPDRIEYVVGVAQKVLEWVNKKRLADAVLEFDNATLEIEERQFVWTFLDSTQRRAIKDEDEAQRKKYADSQVGQQA